MPARRRCQPLTIMTPLHSAFPTDNQLQPSELELNFPLQFTIESKQPNRNKTNG
eukprot:m.412649 g.412649  ORF g.412649 m.412649 type:complete len:54 (-) comp20171_c0_seq2:109-270(-)